MKDSLYEGDKRRKFGGRLKEGLYRKLSGVTLRDTDSIGRNTRDKWTVLLFPTVYNVGKIKEDVPSSAKIIAVVGSQALDGSSSNDIILNDETSVKDIISGHKRTVPLSPLYCYLNSNIQNSTIQ